MVIYQIIIVHEVCNTIADCLSKMEDIMGRTEMALQLLGSDICHFFKYGGYFSFLQIIWIKSLMDAEV